MVFSDIARSRNSSDGNTCFPVHVDLCNFLKISTARRNNGTMCASPIFIRDPGIRH